jgi:hypothetical protein
LITKRFFISASCIIYPLLSAAFSINCVSEVTGVYANVYWHLLPIWFSVLIRPHPAIWRLVHGMAVVYLVSLTFLLFQVTAVIFSNLAKKVNCYKNFGIPKPVKSIANLWHKSLSFSFLLSTGNSILLLLWLILHTK